MKPIRLKENITRHTTNAIARELVKTELMKKGSGMVSNSGVRRVYLHATNANKTQTVVLQIRSKRKGNWHASTDEAYPVTPSPLNKNENKFWVFVSLENTPRYWITPDRWIRNDIHEAHEAYLKRHGGHRARNDASKHHAINEARLEKWKGKWNILGIF